MPTVLSTIICETSGTFRATLNWSKEQYFLFIAAPQGTWHETQKRKLQAATPTATWTTDKGQEGRHLRLGAVNLEDAIKEMRHLVGVLDSHQVINYIFNNGLMTFTQVKQRKLVFQVMKGNVAQLQMYELRISKTRWVTNVEPGAKNRVLEISLSGRARLNILKILHELVSYWDF